MHADPAGSASSAFTYSASSTSISSVNGEGGGAEGGAATAGESVEARRASQSELDEGGSNFKAGDSEAKSKENPQIVVVNCSSSVAEKVSDAPRGAKNITDDYSSSSSSSPADSSALTSPAAPLVGLAPDDDNRDGAISRNPFAKSSLDSDNLAYPSSDASREDERPELSEDVFESGPSGLTLSPVTSSSTCPTLSDWAVKDRHGSTGASSAMEETEEERRQLEVELGGRPLEEEEEEVVERIVIQKHEQRIIVKTPDGEESEKVIVSRFSRSREASPAPVRRGEQLRSSHSAGQLGGGNRGAVGFTLSLPSSVPDDGDNRLREYSSSHDN